MEDIQNEKAYYRLQIGLVKSIVGIEGRECEVFKGKQKWRRYFTCYSKIYIYKRTKAICCGNLLFRFACDTKKHFSASIGDLFVIRVVGNVVDSTVLASMHYAVSHLNVPLVVVLGHTGCGAVNAAINDNANGLIKPTIDKIKLVIGNEKDDYIATSKNVVAGVKEVASALGEDYPKVNVVGAVYFADSGVVEFL